MKKFVVVYRIGYCSANEIVVSAKNEESAIQKTFDWIGDEEQVSAYVHHDFIDNDNTVFTHIK